jgi:hypothetical protein
VGEKPSPRNNVKCDYENNAKPNAELCNNFVQAAINFNESKKHSARKIWKRTFATRAAPGAFLARIFLTAAEIIKRERWKDSRWQD